MPLPKYITLDRNRLHDHPNLDERWVQARIAEDPAMLGLGNLVLKDKERIQPRARRLDLLLQDQDPEASHRYEVEVQLGSTDESHIIRTVPIRYAGMGSRNPEVLDWKWRSRFNGARNHSCRNHSAIAPRNISQ